MLYYLLEQYTVLYVFPWLHDNIQDNFVNNRYKFKIFNI